MVNYWAVTKLLNVQLFGFGFFFERGINYFFKKRLISYEEPLAIDNEKSATILARCCSQEPLVVTVSDSVFAVLF